ncbi:Methyl-accepting chemotaxis protein McpB [Thermoflexales bacterium]|nr:Methyl-accepting chemotaxis protein McpB [Thermoflexales bacterium]
MTITRRLLAPILIGIVLSIVALVLISVNSQQTLIAQREDVQFAKAEAALYAQTADLGRLAQALAFSVSSLPDAQSAFAENDRDKLQDLIDSLYRQLDYTYGVQEMTFYQAPATVFLRVHDPSRSSDDVAHYRQIPVQTISEKVPKAGVEVGESGLGFYGAAPIVYAGEYLGAVEVGLGINQKFLEEFKAREQLDIAIYVKHSQLDYLISTPSILAAPVPIAELDLLFQTSEVQAPAQLFEGALRGQTAIERLTLNNIPYVVQVSPLTNYSGEIIGVAQTTLPRTIVLDTIDASRNTALLWGGVILLVVLATVFSLATITVIRPLRELTQVTNRFRRGDLTARAQHLRRDELGQLGTTFNAMTDEIANLVEGLEQRVATRTAQVRASADVGRAITSILDTEQLLNTIVNVVTEQFGFYYTAIFTLDQASTYLVLREATGEAGHILKERGHRLRVGLDSMVGYATLKREPRVALNAGEDAVRFSNPLLPDTQSEIALPLLVGDQVWGALDVQSTQLNAFDESTIATLQNVAAQIAIALQNAQSYKDLQQTLDYTTRQYELSRTIFTASTPTAAYESLGQVFAMLRGIDRISLLRVANRDVEDQPAEYELATEWDILGGAQFDTGVRYPVAETPLAQLVSENEVVVIRDAKDNQLPFNTREQLTQAGAQAALLVPLVVQNQFAGFIAAIAEQPHDFQDSEIRLVKSAAEQLGVVLNNLQLTTEMQQTLERVALLNRRLSGESWGSYLTSRDQWLVESGHAQPALASHLQVPIVIRGETIGTFNVADARAERQWQTEELTMLQTIAGEVALAIENARLIEQTQRAAQREKDIAGAADKIHRSVNLEAILRTAVEEVMRIAGTNEVAIQIGRAEAPAGNGQHATLS